ncbi:MarR family winged helix-turn-helix transcriptional regulator [Roseibium aggregatum]|uniref:MarR family winged helix-turn-helix transcriptional regulator n=1 Tax=Roseibium aggregatum TaxID=187304 RepID=UPI0025ABDEBE|nr:MarR family transcriptional regulator [Roseibium aggregatum]WJS02522.1 MarR family transcriptional regulator [Roseibium aggregatum]
MRNLEQMPGHLIRRLQQIAVAVFHTEVDAVGFDMTPVQFAALVRVAENPGIDQITLAGLIAYDRTTIAGVVDRLVQKGFLSRAVSEKDRRAKVLHMTDAGTDALSRLGPAVEKAQQVMLSGLDRQEADDFMRLLQKATEAVNDLSRAPLRSGSKSAEKD